MNDGHRRRAVFLDRDGVINRAVVVDGRPHPPERPEDVERLPGVDDACRRLVDAGWLLIVVTNQPDIARGTTTRAEVDAINEVVLDGLPVADVLVCPHDDAEGCECRKPRPGLLVEGASRWNVDLSRSFVVGDRWRDVEAGRAAGVETVFVDRGYAEKRPDAPDHAVEDLRGAAEVILARGTGPASAESVTSGPVTSGSDPVPGDDWDSHWAAYADAVTDNPAQEYRRQLITAAMERVGAPRRLLDIGSGQGDLMVELARKWPTAELVGLELSEEGIRISGEKVPAARFFAVDLTADAVPDDVVDWADVAVCSEVLEHVDDPARFMANALRGVAPGGRVVITVPGGPRTHFDRFIGHRRHFTPAALRRVLVDAGLEVEHVSGAGFPFFNLYKLLVLFRGKALVRDVSAATPPSRLAALVMKVFSWVLTTRWNTERYGWQLVATGRRPMVEPSRR